MPNKKLFNFFPFCVLILRRCLSLQAGRVFSEVVAYFWKSVEEALRYSDATPL